MTCCRKQFTPSENKKNTKLRVLADIYSQMRKGTDITPGDWLVLDVAHPLFKNTRFPIRPYKVVYRGKQNIGANTKLEKIPWKDFSIVEKTLTSSKALDFEYRYIQAYLIIAPF